VSALHAKDTDGIVQALVDSHIAATAVGARALPQIAPLVAAGVTRRAIEGIPTALNIIICENMKDAAVAFRGMVGDHLSSATQRSYLQTHVGFVDTVIGRMVPPLTPEIQAQDPSTIVVEPYKELPVDRSGFIDPIPEIVGMEVCDNFPAYTARKLYIHNCGHALLGYLGHLRGHAFGYEALEDPKIRSLFETALTESVAGIVTAYVVEPAWLEAHIRDLTRRFGNRSLADPIFRLARDPLRKLGPDDRLVGAARLAEGAGVLPDALSWGIAAGYCFDHPEDPLAVELQGRLVSKGFDAVLADVSGIDAGEPLALMVSERYRQLR
jgi:mannitol-1-phosphate 5-dehydrogenase